MLQNSVGAFIKHAYITLSVLEWSKHALSVV